VRHSRLGWRTTLSTIRVVGRCATMVVNTQTKGLESRRGGRLLSRMADSPEHTPRERSLIDEALAAGSLATIATGGALIGLGMRDGETSRVFRLAGRGLLERYGTVGAAPLTSVGVGYLHHLLIATLWGALLAMLVLPLKGVTRVAAALLAAAFYAWLSLDFVPAGLRIGYSVTSNMASAVSIGVALGVALLGGVWLAATETYG
jgi:hypothetical protein